MGTSLVTTISLAFFTLGARQINLCTVGRMQYLVPGAMFLPTVLAHHEPFARAQVGMFLMIMIGFSKPDASHPVSPATTGALRDPVFYRLWR